MNKRLRGANKTTRCMQNKIQATTLIHGINTIHEAAHIIVIYRKETWLRKMLLLALG